MKGNNLIKPRNSLNGSGVDLERIFLEDMKKENYYVAEKRVLVRKKRQVTCQMAQCFSVTNDVTHNNNI